MAISEVFLPSMGQRGPNAFASEYCTAAVLVSMKNWRAFLV